MLNRALTCIRESTKLVIHTLTCRTSVHLVLLRASFGYCWHRKGAGYEIQDHQWTISINLEEMQAVEQSNECIGQSSCSKNVPMSSFLLCANLFAPNLISSLLVLMSTPSPFHTPALCRYDDNPTSSRYYPCASSCSQVLSVPQSWMSNHDQGRRDHRQES